MIIIDNSMTVRFGGVEMGNKKNVLKELSKREKFGITFLLGHHETSAREQKLILK